MDWEFYGADTAGQDASESDGSVFSSANHKYQWVNILFRDGHVQGDANSPITGAKYTLDADPGYTSWLTATLNANAK
jgi:prepilin-type processing-associated H-X9-DG protein